jgi:hypothetical protein
LIGNHLHDRLTEALAKSAPLHRHDRNLQQSPGDAIGACAPLSIPEIRALSREANEETEAVLWARAWEAKEGVAAFLHKCPPNWTAG